MKEVPISDFQHVIDVNLIGTYRVSQKALPHLEKANEGIIINMSSCRATQQSQHGEAYAASKAGISGLSMAMAVSLGPKIRVHVISPGMVDVRYEREQSLMPDSEELGDLQRDFQSEYAPAWGHGKSEALQAKHPVGRVGRGEDIAKSEPHIFFDLLCRFLISRCLQMGRIPLCFGGGILHRGCKYLELFPCSIRII